jgi:hypothetical protein
VKARYDTDAIGEYHIEESVRKTREERSTDGPVDKRASDGMLGDKANNELKGTKKLIAEAGQARLVPGMCFANVLSCKIAEDDGEAHRRRLRVPSTSDDGRSAPGWVSKSARRRSSTVFCFLLTATEADSATTLSQISCTS